MSAPLNREDLRIIHFSLNDDDDEDLGCVVIHKNGNAATGEDPKNTRRQNFHLALQMLAKAMGVPQEHADAFLKCPACNVERLPVIPKWEQEHDFTYRQKVIAGAVTLGTYVVFKSSSDSSWSGGMYFAGARGEEEFGANTEIDDIFLEDALAKANKAVAALIEKQLADQKESTKDSEE